MSEIKNHDFIIGPVDTDSISFCKSNMEPFTEEEQKTLLAELNALMPEFMIYEDDGYYDCCLALKAKNYVLYAPNSKDPKKRRVIKGSAFKSANKEPALVEMLNSLVDCFVKNEGTPLMVYQKYTLEACNIKDISRWCTKKTITTKLLNGTRTNETKVLDAINIDEVQEGEKVYLYYALDGYVQQAVKGEPKFLKNGTPKMVENSILRLKDVFDGNYDVMHYVKRVYDTMSIFSTIINMDEIPKYHNSKGKKELEKLLIDNGVNFVIP